MLNTLYQSIVGTAPPTAIGSAHGLSLNQMQGLANQQFNAAYGQMLNNNQQAHQNQQLAAIQAQYNSILAQNQKQWMVNGIAMTWDEFLDAVCPDADDPHRTFLTLKYRGIK